LKYLELNISDRSKSSSHSLAIMAPKKTGTAPKRKASKSNPSQRSVVLEPTPLQQPILEIFRNTFRDNFLSSNQEDLESKIQEVKGHLFNRDFAAAFGQQDLLEAYCMRWSPSRALGYAEILQDSLITDRIRHGLTEDQPFKVVCIGGGAGAELVSFAALVKELGGQRRMKLELVDIAAWGDVLDKLYGSMVNPPPLNKYAAAHVKAAANEPFIGKDVLQYAFHQYDVLEMGQEQLRGLLQDADLVTIFFTLNELFTTSLEATKGFLLKVRNIMQKGAQLCVIDSAGSYSTVALKGNEEKKYPMQWLLDYMIVDEGRRKAQSLDASVPRWEKVKESDGVWFRVPIELKYGLELEDMRYQIHVYKQDQDQP
jgi:25S rRNA (uracil2843-N3)-methyltransferase